ncbi:phage tail tip lysozyme [Facklamia hominis]|uniref:phage tail tip lysozyme n=1 Tax=Facklamia hominis TaxID=178214 RepID=UPI000352E2C8|nr:phage tail tip lysozyme [Facklamia hominis]EPH10686.1 hypothetical protein HMPREF9260_01143 [Facklamia hominis ACS-120-V-Sch10]
MDSNAKIIWDYLTSHGWSQEAVAGILGNMEVETGIEPNLHEYGGGTGYGLVQWTPGTRLINWAHQNGLDPSNIYTQLKRLEFEVENCHISSINPYIDKLGVGNFRDFTKLRKSPEEMARIFVINYERPSNEGMKLEKRQAAARRWYDKFSGGSSYVPSTSKSTDNIQYYTVQAGDSYWAISRKFGLTVDQLLEMNNFAANHIIHPGDRLIVKKEVSRPIPTPPSGESIQYYTVQAGDSYWGISRKFGLTVDQLLEMNNFAANHIIHPGDRLIVGYSSEKEPSPAPTPSTQTNLEAVVNWFRSRQGKVTYSMDNRLGPNSYDCSSAVFNALKAGGFVSQDTWPGTTETLFQMEGTLLIPISRAEAKFGDIFVAGVKGQSLYGGGHTGVFVAPERIIHCTSSYNGIVETPLEGNYGYGLPLHCYRLRGANNSSPQPSPLPNSGNEGTEHLVKSYAETGRFTANQVVNIHNSCSKSSAVAAILNSGDSVYYDSVYITNKYMYISYVSYSGVRRYVPICTYINGVKGSISGTIG